MLYIEGEPNMKDRKSHGYKNYDSASRNEHVTNNTEKNIKSTAVLKHDMQADDTMYEQNLHRAQHQSIRRQNRGWMRSCKENGWRIESASQQDESIGVRR